MFFSNYSINVKVTVHKKVYKNRYSLNIAILQILSPISTLYHHWLSKYDYIVKFDLR